MEMIEVIEKTESMGLSSICESVRKFEEITDPKNLNSRVSDLEQLISRDQTIASEVLRVANSSFYGRGTIESLYESINLLGWDTIRRIGISASVRGLINNVINHKIAKRMFNRNIGVGNLGDYFFNQLKKQQDIITKNEDLYTPLLLQDIGSLAMLQCIDNYWQKISELKKTKKTKNIVELEQELYGFSHDELGEQIIYRNGLPQIFQVFCKQHHFIDFYSFEPNYKKELIIGKLADISYFQKNYQHISNAKKSSVEQSSSEIEILKIEDFSLDKIKHFSTGLEISTEQFTSLFETTKIQTILAKIRSQQF